MQTPTTPCDALNYYPVRLTCTKPFATSPTLSNSEQTSSDEIRGLSPTELTAIHVVRYMINVKQIAKFVVALGDNVSPMDIEEGMRVGVERSGKYQVIELFFWAISL